MVGYGDSDVGVSIISYTMERNTFIDYSPAVGTDSMVWVTQPPQKLSAASNLLRWGSLTIKIVLYSPSCRIFDPYSWLFILVSLVCVSLTSVFIARISQSYGVITSDTIMMLLQPLQMVLGEQLESGEWFVKKVFRMIIHQLNITF